MPFNPIAPEKRNLGTHMRASLVVQRTFELPFSLVKLGERNEQGANPAKISENLNRSLNLNTRTITEPRV